MAAGRLIVLVLTAAAAAYQLLTALACVLFLKLPAAHWSSRRPAVSILKPVRGLDPKFSEALASHGSQTGEFEILCGVQNLDDDAIAVIKDIPGVQLIHARTTALNGKAAALIDLAAKARYDLLVANDADVRVEPDYLDRVTAPLADPSVGLVTCLYRPVADTFAARLEGLGILTDFAPSVLVARLLGVDDFAMGSTLAIRRADLERIGGFAAISNYLADDYQLGQRIHSLGLHCILSDVVIETHIGGTWKEVWRHQLRWARTIRVSRPGGYLGLPITNATLWVIVALAAGSVPAAIALLALRFLNALLAGAALKSREPLRLLLLVPLRDLLGLAVWFVGLFGHTVEWRGLHLRLNSDGRIESVSPAR